MLGKALLAGAEGRYLRRGVPDLLRGAGAQGLRCSEGRRRVRARRSRLGRELALHALMHLQGAVRRGLVDLPGGERAGEAIGD
jgi:hypothetical protein